MGNNVSSVANHIIGDLMSKLYSTREILAAFNISHNLLIYSQLYCHSNSGVSKSFRRETAHFTYGS